MVVGSAERACSLPSKACPGRNPAVLCGASWRPGLLEQALGGVRGDPWRALADGTPSYRGANAIEAGFITGEALSGPNAGWANAMKPYFTLNNGVKEWNPGPAYDLPANTVIWMAEITAPAVRRSAAFDAELCGS